MNKLKLYAGMAERRLILNTLSQTKGNKTKAAIVLGVDRKTLYNKITELSISAEEIPEVPKPVFYYH